MTEIKDGKFSHAGFVAELLKGYDQRFGPKNPDFKEGEGSMSFLRQAFEGAAETEEEREYAGKALEEIVATISEWRDAIQRFTERGGSYNHPDCQVLDGDLRDTMSHITACYEDPGYRYRSFYFQVLHGGLYSRLFFIKEGFSQEYRERLLKNLGVLGPEQTYDQLKDSLPVVKYSEHRTTTKPIAKPGDWIQLTMKSLDPAIFRLDYQTIGPEYTDHNPRSDHDEIYGLRTAKDGIRVNMYKDNWLDLSLDPRTIYELISTIRDEKK